MPTGPSVWVTPNAGLASALAFTFDATMEAPAALVGPSVIVSPSAGLASAIGWATSGDGSELLVDAELAEATAATFDVTVVEPNPTTTAFAEVAAAIAATFDLGGGGSSATVTVSAGLASATASAPGVALKVTVYAEIASAIAVASGSTAAVFTRPSHGGVRVSGRPSAVVSAPRIRGSVTVPTPLSSGVSSG